MLTEKIAPLFDDKSQNKQFSGVVLIQRQEEVLFSGAYGYASRSWNIRNQLDTRFRLASISKMFTAVAILKLIEAGKLTLDTRVVDCLELENTTIPAEATVYHMLTMTSGIADWFEESGNWEEDWAALCRQHPLYLFRRNQDYLPLFSQEKPNGSVGAKHQYNGAGYILLGLIIERLSGLSYFEAIRQHVFAPAGMTGSDFLALDGVDADVAEGYIPIHDDNKAVIGWKKNIYATTPEAAADGGASATAVDMVAFSRALRNGRLLTLAHTQAMLTPHVVQNTNQFRGYDWQYGYGNMFILDQAGQIVRWGHTGEEDGVSCRFYHYPQKNLDVVILGNQSWCAGQLAWAIHDLILEGS